MYYATRGSYCLALRAGMVTCGNHAFPKGNLSGFLESRHCIFVLFPLERSELLVLNRGKMNFKCKKARTEMLKRLI